MNEHGLFVTLSDTGVTGFVPVRNLSGRGLAQDFFNYDRRHACFTGQRSRRQFRLGDPLMVRVQEANAVTGSLIFMPEAGQDEPTKPLRPANVFKRKDKDNKSRARSKKRRRDADSA